MLSAQDMAGIARGNAGDGPGALSAAGFDALLRKATTLAVSRREGFAILIVAGRQADLHSLEVMRGAQGRGIGSQILRAVLDRARDAGVEEVFLEVAVDNARARRIYDRAGFAAVGRRKAYYRHADGTRTDAVVMVRTMSPGADFSVCPARGQTDAT